MKNTKIIYFFSLFLIGTCLFSCYSEKTAESIFYDVMKKSRTPIGEKFDSFLYKDALRFKEELSDGTKTYTINDGYTYYDEKGTLFYFRNDECVGFRTSNPEYRCNILGYSIGSPFFDKLGFDSTFIADLGDAGLIIDHPPSEYEEGWPNHKVIRANDSSYSYVWYCNNYNYDTSFQINIAVDFFRNYEAPNYGAGIFEVLIDPNGVFPL